MDDVRPESVFVAVMSRVSSVEARQAQREVWAAWPRYGWTVTVRFPVCLDGITPTEYRSLLEENSSSGDLEILQGCTEGYKNLTGKLISTLQLYVQKYISHKFFVKVDDDTYFAWPRMRKVWADLESTYVYTGAICMPWFMCGGCGYSISRDLALVTLPLANATTHWAEDWSLGLWIQAVERTHNFNVTRKYTSCNNGGPNNAAIGVHRVKDLRCMASIERDLGRLAHLGECEPLPDRLTEKMNSTTEAAKHCLKFLHIPHTGGQLVEALGLRAALNNHSSPSLWGRYDDSLHCSDNGGSTVCHVGEVQCHAWHVPPMLSAKMAGQYLHNRSCSTFCVVRHPLERFIDAWKVLAPNRDFEVWASETLDHLNESGFGGHNCGLQPQTRYVFADASRTHQVCTRILKFENLEKEFNGLMASYDLHIRYDSSEVGLATDASATLRPKDLRSLPRNMTTMSHEDSDHHSGAVLVRPDVPAALQKRILSMYQEDAESLGYGK